MTRSTRFLPLALLTLVAPAFAQAVPAAQLARGAHGGRSLAKGGYVARDAQELADQGLDRLLSDAQRAKLDWDREMVIAVCQGPVGGGHDVAIEGIRWRVARGGPDAPATKRLEVHVRVTRPGPGEPSTRILRTPYHVVKVPRTKLPVVFVPVKDEPDAPAKDLAQDPAKTPAKAPAKPPAQAPAETPAQPPAKTPVAERVQGGLSQAVQGAGAK